MDVLPPPPTHLLTPHSQSIITVWPTISFFTCPSFSTLIHRHICSFLYFHTYLSVHHRSTLSHAASSDSSIRQQTYFSKHARANTYCLKYSLPPATLSLSLPRRRLGRTPLVAVLLFFSCRTRALFFLLCSPPIGVRQWHGSSLLV